MRLATDYCVSTPTASGSILLLPFSIVPMRRTPQFCAERIRSGEDGGPLPTEGHVSRHLLAHGERPMPVGRDARERFFLVCGMGNRTEEPLPCLRRSRTTSITTICFSTGRI